MKLIASTIASTDDQLIGQIAPGSHKARVLSDTTRKSPPRLRGTILPPDTRHPPPCPRRHRCLFSWPATLRPT
jgi:hypothetical protein